MGFEKDAIDRFGSCRQKQSTFSLIYDSLALRHGTATIFTATPNFARECRHIA
jgi:hypothetical protein